VPASGGGFRANGLYEPGEPPIAGVQVTLASPACSAVITTATTSNVGGYAFTGLQPGDYCVIIDPAQEPNTSILIPGSWTAPVVVDGAVTMVVRVGAGQQRSDVNFGWDYQFLPAPGETACTNRAGFVADVTIPDNTRLTPGETFLKTWRVRNEGTCTWGPSRQVHSLVFFNGEPMGTTDAAPLPGDVPPGATVDLSISMTAPTTPGRYRSEWMLGVGPEGGMLGVGGGQPLWVQILVEPGATGAGNPPSAPPTATPIPGDEAASEPTATPTLEPVLPTATPEPIDESAKPPPAAQQYVLALADAPIYAGSPGAELNQIGFIAGGQVAMVTGVSADSAWWRINCPDGSADDCWVSADPGQTQLTTTP
jgi:hypothetical protein